MKRRKGYIKSAKKGQVWETEMVLVAVVSELKTGIEIFPLRLLCLE